MFSDVWKEYRRTNTSPSDWALEARRASVTSSKVYGLLFQDTKFASH